MAARNEDEPDPCEVKQSTRANKKKRRVKGFAMDKQHSVPLSVAAMRYAKSLSPKGRGSWSGNSAARKIVFGIMSLSALIAVSGCSRGDDAYRTASGRVAESAQEEDAEVAAQLLSLMWQAQQEQAQRDRWNQMQAEEDRWRSWNERVQREARERQIRQEEYIRQDAREKYQRANQGERAIMKSFGY